MSVRARDRSRGGNAVVKGRVLLQANFTSHLISSLLLTRGTGSATFIRATTATVVDFEGNVKLCKAGEARFAGARRVGNLVGNTEMSAWTFGAGSSAVKNATDPSGVLNAAFTVTITTGTNGIFTLTNSVSPVTSTYTMSVMLRAVTGSPTVYITAGSADGVNLTLTTSWTRYTFITTGLTTNQYFQLATSNVKAGPTVVIEACYPMKEDVTGQSVQTASEYVSSTENSAGAFGVKYFTTMPDGITPINSANSKFAYNCAATGDYFSTPDAPANRITGNLTLMAWVAPTSWTPATVQTVVSKDTTMPGGRSYALNIQPTTGTLQLNISLDGSTILQYTSTVGAGFTAGTKHVIGVERESATGLVRFYTSEDKVNWTQLGATIAGTAGAIFAGNADVQFGALASTGLEFSGRIYDSEIYNGLAVTDGVGLAVDFDPSNWTAGTTWTSSDSGEVWTINGNAKVYQGEWDSVGPIGYLGEAAATNLFKNSAVGVTQATSVLTAAAYTLSFSGTGTIIGTDGFVGTLTGISASDRVSLTVTATALAAVLTVTGSCTGVQLELGSYATSYIPTTSAAVTRNVDACAYQTSGNIGTTGSVYFEFTPTHAPVGTIALFGSYTNASNYVRLLHDATNIILRKRIAGVNYDATKALAFTAGTTYKIAARFGASGQQLAIDGVVGTADANISPAVVAPTMHPAADAAGTGHPTASIRNFNTSTTPWTDAQLRAVTL